MGQKIKKLRMRSGLSQIALARLLGFKSQQVISRWECNDNEPDVDSIRKLKHIFNCTYEELLEA